ncbi:MAG: PIN domain-containing protein [Candidatus Sulfotelmatobacter sp.]|jgi:predicted nucleic acid-binding protein
MRLALDTNILVYAEGINGEARQAAALQVLSRLPRATTFIPVQVLGELFRVLAGKSPFSPKVAQARIADWQASFPLIETSPSILSSAIDLAVQHKVRIWDAVILAAAAEAGCRLLLSEDLQDGFTWSGVTVVNPFAEKKHELLAGILEP